MERKGDLRRLSAGEYLAANLHSLLDHHFDGKKPGKIGRFCAKHPSFVLSKIQRALRDGSVSVKTVDELAKIFHLEPYQLFLPKLNPKHPQVAIPLHQFRAINALKNAAPELTESP